MVGSKTKRLLPSTLHIILNVRQAIARLHQPKYLLKYLTPIYIHVIDFQNLISLYYN